jgi:hypothetical protein
VLSSLYAQYGAYPAWLGGLFIVGRAIRFQVGHYYRRPRRDCSLHLQGSEHISVFEGGLLPGSVSCGRSTWWTGRVPRKDYYNHICGGVDQREVR